MISSARPTDERGQATDEAAKLIARAKAVLRQTQRAGSDIAILSADELRALIEAAEKNVAAT